ncbi:MULTISPECIES: DoxX family protein [unclassified Mycobacterium]|uniref:DoxX family protein n=1 Tax=unclassified Mycobacterium TaxID=2642494 RepID=UPI00036F6950|nr:MULTISPECIES: DoxX family protein [unclassified Mycobacterium]SDZ95686.1 DoxX-like family protein [Mycobacterium sp. 283mftsu]
MHAYSMIAAAALAIILVAAGAPKIVNAPSAQRHAEHLGVPHALNRAIGLLELVAVAGLLAGFILRPLAIAAATGVTLLMIGAAGSHIRVHDRILAVVPALAVGATAAAILVLELGHIS